MAGLTVTYMQEDINVIVARLEVLKASLHDTRQGNMGAEVHRILCILQGRKDPFEKDNA